MKNITVLIFTALLAAACGSSSSSGETPPTPTPPTPTTIIRLFYYGQTPTDGKQGDPGQFAESHKMYSATSEDGIAYTEESGVRFELEMLTDPDVFFDGTRYVMFTSQGTTLIKATSDTANGTYVQDESFQWGNGGVCSTTLINGIYKTFYCDNQNNAISVAVYDPTAGTLTNSGVALANPHDGAICDPSVIQLGDGSWLMFYKLQPSGGGDTGPSGHQVYTATSQDGVTWTATMTLIRDQSSVPGAVRVDEKIYVYFVDGSGTFESGMGVGVSSDEGQTFEFTSVTFTDAVETQQVDPHPIPYE